MLSNYYTFCELNSNILSVVLQETKKIQKIFKKYLMNVIHKFSEFWSRKQRENKTFAVSKYVYHPNTYTFTKNWAGMWDFANFVKSGWSDLKDDRAFSPLHQELPQILVLCFP